MAAEIYAELLLNIRQISVVASLPSPVDASATQATVQDDVVEVKHHNETRTLRLPGRTALKPGRLPIPSQGAVLSWRLPLLAGEARREAPEAEVPWPADGLGASDALICRSCRSVVLEGVQVWKDLPSENWAEMMEFWHCHKPDHEHGHDHTDGKASEDALAARGYGANSVIMAQKGVGLVDLTSFLLSEDDCVSLTFHRVLGDDGFGDTKHLLDAPALDALQNLYVSCAACSAQLGHYSLRAAAVNLFKWTVSIAGRSRVPDVYGCLSLALAATMARSGSSKALIMPILPSAGSRAPGDQVLYAWVLNGRICYASTGADGPVPAAKLLYRIVDRAEADAMLGSFVDDVPEIYLPAPDIAAVVDELRRTNALLPLADRTFQGWTVGLLTRWQDATE